MDTYVIMPVGAGEHAGKLGEPVGADLRVCPNNVCPNNGCDETRRGRANTQVRPYVCPNDGCDEPVGAGRTHRFAPTSAQITSAQMMDVANQANGANRTNRANP